MIKDTIKIHDKYQFEIKTSYSFKSDKKSTSYNIETYFFIPSNLGINKNTYKKEIFYNDIQTYIRFKTPTILLRNIASGENSPIEKLRESFNAILYQQDNKNILNYEHQIKMFCCILKSALRDHVDFVKKKTLSQDVVSAINDFTGSIKIIVQKYRDLRNIIAVPSVDNKLFSVYLFGDEYLSLLVEYYTYNLLEIIKNFEFTEKEHYEKILINLIKSEVDYRNNNKYPSIARKDSDNEVLLFRKSVLKKYMENILFLNTRVEEEGKIIEQIIFALAAGIAMFFFTWVVFYSQYKYGLTTPLLLIVISYMFKDRIKESIRIYLSDKVKNFLFDHKLFIYTDSKEKIGVCEESFDFVKEQKIGSHLIKLRNKDHITEIENGWVGEKIILYRKRIRIISKYFKKIYHNYKIDAINDITRFNVSNFLTKMDNPQKTLYVCEDDSFYKIQGERVYHLNLIIKYSSEKGSSYERYRIILNRDGIKRIEEVISA